MYRRCIHYYLHQIVIEYKTDTKRKAQADLSFRCLDKASFIVLNFRSPPNERFSSAYKLRFNVQLNRDCVLGGSERVL